jgi:glycolate oxidase FAD binding subunit
VLEAGVRLADAQAVFAEAGQMLALDPPLGEGDAATVGGVFSTADAGPLRHRYGAPRDLVLGMTVALPDGTVATSGGRVIKNVAGYDLGKLFTGSFGTLGLTAQVVVRLHPRPPTTATAVGLGDDVGVLASAANALALAPLELEALDVAWRDGRGAILARAGGTQAGPRAASVVEALRTHGLDADVHDGDDEELWAAQRAGQRSSAGTVVRVSGLPGELERVLAAVVRAGGSLVGRAGVGVSWIALPEGPPDAVAETLSQLRHELAPFPCAVLDAPAAVRERVGVWGVDDPGLVALSRRVKERFDPLGVCNPGVFVGGL